MQTLKLCVAVLLLAGCGLSLVSDYARPAADGMRCRWGLCRADQLIEGLPEDTSRTPEVLKRLLDMDAANPYRWADFAEYLSSRGENQQAAEHFDRAVTLAPNGAAILMRAANFHFGHNQSKQGAELASRVLRLTPTFNEIIYTYYAGLGQALPRLLGTAVPAEKEPAQAWFHWLFPRASEADLLATWSWMEKQRSADDASAGDFAWALWNRKLFQTGAEMWAAWLGNQRGDYLRPELLSNRRFAEEPQRSPYDWTITPNSAVDVRRENGLVVKFTGTANVAYSNVRQMAAIGPGCYEFSAVVAAQGLDTNEGPFFHIYDAENPSRLDVTTKMLLGTLPQQKVETTFRVGTGAHAVVVQLERRPSKRFDNKIAGSLEISEVSLRACGK